MQNNILAKIEKYIKKYKQYKIWQKIVGSLACVVVFVTTYMLILPAITMEQSTFCEMEEHKHSEKCYKQQLICGYEEESETAHVHNESCYETEQVLICGKEESQGHVHDDSCIKKEQVLICTDTSEEHEHTDACYEEQEVYICGMEEGEGAHTHGPECYEAHQVLICDQPENTPVHTHTEACYKKVLICEKEEHTHTLVCFSDPSADVESSKDWERSVSKVKLTGIWADDVIAIAQSQIGYTESTKNYQVQKDGKTIKGYTRYGAWYGDEYGDWCAMFVSFCLNYAEIPQNTVPWESNCSEWIKTLSDSYRKAAGYIPVKGDIIFFDNSGDGTADHVGLVETVNENNGTLKTIEGNASDRVKENSYSVNDSEILGYGVLPENPEMAVEEDKNGGKTEEEETQKIKEAETEPETKEDGTRAENSLIWSIKNDTDLEMADEGAMLLSGTTDENSDDTVTEIDLNTYVTSVILRKKVGAVWIECTDTEFTTDDQMQAEIIFENLSTEELQKNSNTVQLKLPDNFDCSKFKGNTYKTYDGDTESGTYTYQLGEDGCWYIVLVLNGDYVKQAGNTIGGSLKLEYEWDRNSATDEGEKQTVTIGSWSEEVTIKKGQNSDSGQTGTHYGLLKTAGKLSYSTDGSTAYMDYTVTLTVNDNTQGPIILTDNLTGQGWTYDNTASIQITSADNDNNPAISWDTGYSDDTETNRKAVISIGDNSSIVKAGTYTINYRVQNTGITNPGSQLYGQINNSVSLKDGEQTLTSSTWVNTNKGAIDKQGRLTEENDGTYIDYTVYINCGDIIQNVTEETIFTDTIPDDLELSGEVIVKQYDTSGMEKSSIAAAVTGQNISCTLPSGQYYYIITYRTKVKDTAEIPLGGKTISNTGTLKGGIEASDTNTVMISKNILHKSFQKQKVEENDGQWMNIMNWESRIDVIGSMEGYVYEDWAGIVYMDGKNQCLISMSEEQMKAIKVLDNTGQEINSQYYTVNKLNREENGVQNGLFQIVFTKEVNGPVTIQYQTTADLSSYKGDGSEYLTFVNYASVTKGGNIDRSQASTTPFQYTHQNPNVIKKTKSGSEWNSEETTTQLPSGETTIPWLVTVNGGRTLHEDLIVTDTIADGMFFVKDSLKITVEGGSVDKIIWDFDETTNTLTVQIPKEAYSGDNYSGAINISYRTELPEDYFTGSDMTQKFTNTASVEGEEGTNADSTFTQEVTRQVVGKTGNYDEKDQILTYNIVLNPDASKLNNGNTLMVTDTLDRGTLGEAVSLKSLTLFTALKNKNEDGTTSVLPGRLVQELTESNETTDFQYSWAQDTGTFIAYVPDETAYVLVARYYVNAEVADTVQMKNTVQLSGGSSSWNTKDESTSVVKDTSGTTHTSGDDLILTKHDSAQYSLLLSGAEFKLEEYDENSQQWVSARSTESVTVNSTLITDNSGKARTQVRRNILYRLTETTAPTEYIKDETPYYFIVMETENTCVLPEKITGDDLYKKALVNIYTVVKDQYEKIEIDRYNEKDKTIVKAGELRVNKKWLNHSGDEITDPTELAKKPEVAVTLTRHEVPEGFKISITCGEWSPKIIAKNIWDGAYVYLQGWNIQDRWNSVSLPEGVTVVSIPVESDQAPICKIGPIKSDLIIEDQSMYYNDVGTYLKQEGGIAPTGTIDTVIGTITLNAANDWSGLWQGLKVDEGITYTITENTVDGYKTTYQLNGTDFTEEQEITLGQNGDRVTVINEEEQGFELPETGGPGTKLYTLGGLLLALSAGIFLLYNYTRRRKEDCSSS